jgi:hypothetical protein
MSIVARPIDSELGRWTHTEWRPRPGDAFESMFERIWDFEGMAAAPRERVFPDGGIELILQLDDRYLDVDGLRTRQTPAACATGIHSRAIVVQAPPRPCRVLGVRLQPAGAWSLLAHPLEQLADVTVDLGHLLGREASDLAERCDDARDGIARVTLVLQWLRGRYARIPARRSADPAAQWVAHRIRASGGTQPIARLRATAGLSDARLLALFRQQVGVTPREFLAGVRFPESLSLPEFT